MVRAIIGALVISLLSCCASSPFYHKYFMSGQVVGFDGDQVVFCIGTETGASIGQEFEAYRFTFDGPTVEGKSEYDVIRVGSVKVRQIVNDHFAKGEVLSGEVIKHDTLFAK